MNIFIFDSEDEMSNFMLRKWREIAEEAILSKGRFNVALSGGSTPVPFYRKLAHSGMSHLNAKTHIFVVDEKMVPFCYIDSNYGMMLATFIDGIDLPGENLHHIPYEENAPETAAAKYEADIKESFGLSEGEVPVFDLVTLGIGEDGHTASLFPQSPVLDETNRLVVAATPENAAHQRVTLTMKVINNAENIVFLLRGKNKAAILKKVAEERDPGLPASLVSPVNGTLIFVADREAGSDLTKYT